MPIGPNGEMLPYDDTSAGLMALLGGSGAAEPQQEETLDWGARLQRMIADARAVTEEGGVSEKERLLLEKITTMIQQIRAEREKEEEGLLQGKVSPGALRRAAGGSQ